MPEDLDLPVSWNLPGTLEAKRLDPYRHMMIADTRQRGVRGALISRCDVLNVLHKEPSCEPDSGKKPEASLHAAAETSHAE